MNTNRRRNMFLRIIAAAIMLIVVVIISSMAYFSIYIKENSDSFSAVDGLLDVSQGFDLVEEPLSLDGVWEAYEGQIPTNDTISTLTDNPSEKIVFPIGSIVQATLDASYRVRIKLPEQVPERIFIYIPAYYDEVTLYVNGEKQNGPYETPQWIENTLFDTMIQITSFDASLAEQEIVISGNFSQNSTTLHKRQIYLGTAQSISSLSSVNVSNEMFLAGILLLILINGYVFMIFRPGHTIISLITLFDTMYMMRILFSMNYALGYLKCVFPRLNIADTTRCSIVLFFIMVGGVVGCLLSEKIFDPQRKVPRWLVAPMPFVYAVYAIIFPLFPKFFDNIGSKFLFVTYALTFVGVFLQFRECWKTQKTGYYMFQFIKTSYVGIIIFLDIVRWSIYFDFLTLIYMYGLFLVLHIIVRLYDNNQSYHHVEQLNQGLESTVEERTRELSEANKILSELSTRDVLTNAFNRLYFENVMEKAFSDKSNVLHLCMFDLDFFKKINDTYGHDMGDEQLKYVAKKVDSIVGDTAVFARVGGEEFMILFENKTDAEVLSCIENIHKAIADDATQNTKHTTASFGMTKRYHYDTIKTLLKRADVSLYHAKNTGRNKIVTDFSE